MKVQSDPCLLCLPHMFSYILYHFVRVTGVQHVVKSSIFQSQTVMSVFRTWLTCGCLSEYWSSRSEVTTKVYWSPLQFPIGFPACICRQHHRFDRILRILRIHTSWNRVLWSLVVWYIMSGYPWCLYKSPKHVLVHFDNYWFSLFLNDFFCSQVRRASHPLSSTGWVPQVELFWQGSERSSLF